jgi:mono/diheme cytochrome c family protein
MARPDNMDEPAERGYDAAMTRLLTLLFAATLAAGCGKETKESPPAGETPAAAETAAPVAAKPLNADDVFEKRCVVCHGKSGKGDGPGAAALTPKPRDYTSAEWQESVTDEFLEKIIVGGGPAVGKNAAMPGNPDLRNKPEVVKGLVQKIRGFKGQP